MDHNGRRAKTLTLIAERGLASYMNNTKWRELCEAVKVELPFPPAFLEKNLFEDHAFGHLPNVPTYLGDWRHSQSCRLFEWAGLGIETDFIKVAPRRAYRRGQLGPPQIQDCTDDFTMILRRLKIPYVEEGAFIVIYGHAAGVQFTFG